jgi:hypothetical protein
MESKDVTKLCKIIYDGDLAAFQRVFCEPWARACVNQREPEHNRTPLHALLLGTDGPGFPLRHKRPGDMLVVATHLVQCGADVNAAMAQAAVGTLGLGAMAPLHLASIHGCVRICRFLLDHGADVNARTEKDYTALHFAAAHEYRLGASPMRASKCRLLIRRGANVNAVALDNLTPLLYLQSIWTGAEAETLAVWGILLKAGADVNAPGHLDGSTPFLRAVKHSCLFGTCDLDFLKSLIVRYGANVNAAGNDTLTPLHYTAFIHDVPRPQLARLLMEHGADAHARDRDGNTPLHLACRASPEHIASRIVRELLRIPDGLAERAAQAARIRRA